MRPKFTSGLIFKLARNFVIIIFVVFSVGNIIQFTLIQNKLKQQGEEQLQRQQEIFTKKIEKTENDLKSQFLPLMEMLAKFSEAPLLARISETDHSNFDVIGSLQNCFTFYTDHDDIKQCTDLLVFRFITNDAIVEINRTFISTAIRFLTKNEDLVGVFVEDWEEKNYIGLAKTEDGRIEKWSQLDQFSQFPYLEKEILDEDGEYLGKIFFAYDLTRVEQVKADAKANLELSTKQIEKNIQINRQSTILGEIFEGVILFVILVAALFFMSIRLIVRPIHDLENSANQIAKGHLNTRSIIHSNDEIGSLANSFNNMAENLQTTMTSRDELALEIEQRKIAEEEKRKVIVELEKALDEIKILSGIIPICSYCKQIRDDKGYWNQLEKYISEHSDAQFSHSICNKCLQEHFPDFKD